MIEGEALLPTQVAELMRAFPGQVSAVFLGYRTVSTSEKLAWIRSHPSEVNDWVNGSTYLMSRVGIEPTTYGLKVRCSTN